MSKIIISIENHNGVNYIACSTLVKSKLAKYDKLGNLIMDLKEVQ